MSGLADLVAGYESESSQEDISAAKRSGGEESVESSGEEGSSDGEEEENGGKGNGPNKLMVEGDGVALPSVDDLFSSTSGPEFLVAPMRKGFELKSMRKKRDGSGTGSSRLNPQDQKRLKGVDTETSSGGGIKKPQERVIGSSASPAPDSNKGRLGEKGAKGKEKLTAKERVKGQRLKGQAGIGSDFRTWKSDLEMTMRQEFD
ncbi:unnamed protein product [Choristocarpus tenellus]